jgi:hypothetical protein
MTGLAPASARHPMHSASSSPIVPLAIVAQLADQLAAKAEHGADLIASCFAGLAALAHATGDPRLVEAAGEIRPFLALIAAAEMTHDGPLNVPPIVAQTLEPFLGEIIHAGRTIPDAVDMPEIPPATYAAGFQAGRKSVLLLQRSQKVRGRPVRQRRRG